MDILLIHSDKKLVGIYEQKLKNLFSFDSAFDGLTGLRKINSLLPHMVIAAPELPYLSGLSLLKHVRSHKNLHAIPFVFIAHNNPFSEEALRHGANDWINLSEISPTFVLEKIHSHIYANRNLIKHLKSNV